MIRVLVQGTTLDEGEQHHLRVRRAEPGELVDVRDGHGLVGRGRLVRTGKTWSVEIEASETLPPPPAMVIAVGAGDRDRFGWLVEKATELGVTHIVPLESARTPGVASKLRDEQIERLQRRALEAIKQCGAAWAPVIEVPVSVDTFASQAMVGQRWLADAYGQSPATALDDAPITVAVGPEGGFSAEERATFVARGFTSTTLGPHILRFETAAIAAVAAVAVARQRERHG